VCVVLSLVCVVQLCWCELVFTFLLVVVCIRCYVLFDRCVCVWCSDCHNTHMLMLGLVSCVGACGMCYLSSTMLVLSSLVGLINCDCLVIIVCVVGHV